MKLVAIRRFRSPLDNKIERTKALLSINLGKKSEHTWLSDNSFIDTRCTHAEGYKEVKSVQPVNLISCSHYKQLWPIKLTCGHMYMYMHIATHKNL